MNQPILSDALELVKGIDDESVDLVIIDPPYNNKIKDFKIEEKQYVRISESWDDYTDEEYYELIKSNLIEYKRVMKKGASILVFGSFYNAFDIHILMRELFIFRNFVTWYKSDAMPIKFAKQIGLYAYSCEYINYFSKGKVKTFNYDLAKRLNGNKQQRDVLMFSGLHENTGHPSTKSLKLIEYLIKIHSKEGDLVLDNFAGSFTTALACEKLRRNWICGDNKKEYVEIGKKRIENYRRQRRLF